MRCLRNRLELEAAGIFSARNHDGEGVVEPERWTESQVKALRILRLVLDCKRLARPSGSPFKIAVNAVPVYSG